MGNSTSLGIWNSAASREARNQGGFVLTSWLQPSTSLEDTSPGLQKGGIEWTQRLLSKVRMLPIVPYKPVIFIFAPLSLD